MTFHAAPRVRQVCWFFAACLLAAGPGCEKPASSAAPATQSAAGVAADLAAGRLAGLYVRQQMVPLFFNGRMTFNLQREFFYFFPDGHVLFGVPAGGLKEHPAAADFAAASKDVAPDHRGKYAVAGGKITFTPDKGTPTTEPFSVPNPADDGVLQIGPPSVVGSVKALPFKDGQRLDGSYQFDGTVGLGGENTIFNVKTLTFHPDGKLDSDQLSGVDTKGIETRAGSSGVTTGGRTSAAGTYRFAGTN